MSRLAIDISRNKVLQLFFIKGLKMKTPWKIEKKYIDTGVEYQISIPGTKY